MYLKVQQEILVAFNVLREHQINIIDLNPLNGLLGLDNFGL